MIIGVLQADLSSAIGGGQTFFRNLIKSTSHTYLFPSHDKDAAPSLNFIPLPLVNFWQRHCHVLDFSRLSTPNGVNFDGRQSDLLDLMDMVQCFQGHDLDILEIPDYLPFSAFIPAICRYLRVDVGKFVLSMHGTLSMALEDNWAPFSGDFANLKYYEDLLARIVDVRYGIGARYIQGTSNRLNVPIHLLDPGQIFHFPKLSFEPQATKPQEGNPDLVFIGRHEKWKGPDIFVDIVSKLDQNSFGKVRIFGPPVSIEGTSSTDRLTEMAALRGIDISFEVHSRQKLIEKFQSERMIAVFPSRLDTFNLSALEALLNGCPCIISRECGVLDYLDAAYPGIPYVRMGDRSTSDLATFTRVLDNYDTMRSDLRDFLRITQRKPVGQTITEIYAAPAETDQKSKNLLNHMFDQISRQFERLFDVAKKDNISILSRELEVTVNRSRSPTRSMFAAQSDDLGRLAQHRAEKSRSKVNKIVSAVLSSKSGRASKFEELARSLFDSDWYLDRYRDIQASGVDPYRHYIDFGANEKRWPNSSFDGKWYLDANPDVAAAKMNALHHYVMHGADEDRNPHPDFNSFEYRKLHQLPQSQNPLLHFLQNGGSLADTAGPSRIDAITAATLVNIFQVTSDLSEDIVKSKTFELNSSTFAYRSDEILKRLNRHNFSGDRITAYRFAAELERQRGNDILCATYYLRALRLRGVKEPAVAEMTAGLLEKAGYGQEAIAARLLYGDGTPDQVFDYLSAQERKFRRWAASEAAEVIDKRTIVSPRVSIIVSVYNGVNKIGIFLETLQNVTLKSRQSIDLVIVDSASTDGTGDWIKTEIGARSILPPWLSIVYIRSQERETIQKAWNRGIQAARGKYLAFMGVDECNRADAYDKMADYLDLHTSVDWVVSDALVQDVDMSCAFVRDIMIYRRQFETKDDHLLECCYVSYVGCLYRADIHERFGYYDDSFRAAGDTEFKNRLLRSVNFGFIDECLGFFTNYPEERVTQSPLAELEDLRAWYLHRSLGGLMFRFEKSSADVIIALFIRSLDYKKSYMERRCTDLELASNLAKLVEMKFPDAYARIAKAAKYVDMALNAYRLLDGLTEPEVDIRSRLIEYCKVRDKIIEAANILIDCYDNLAFLGHELSLDFISDNRSHQHNNMWASQSKVESRPAPRM